MGRDPSPARQRKALGCLVLDDKVTDRFEQHILLWPSEVNSQLLRRDNCVVIRIVIGGVSPNRRELVKALRAASIRFQHMYLAGVASVDVVIPKRANDDIEELLVLEA